MNPVIDFSDPEWKAKFQEVSRLFCILHLADLFRVLVSIPYTFDLKVIFNCLPKKKKLAMATKELDPHSARAQAPSFEALPGQVVWCLESEVEPYKLRLCLSYSLYGRQ